MNASPSDSPQPKPLKKKKNGSKNSTRAVVANLNRDIKGSKLQTAQKFESVNTQNTSTPMLKQSYSTSLTGANDRSPSPLPLDQMQRKDLSALPDFFVVRPAPSTSRGKVERNDQRIFINRLTGERMGLHQGRAVFIQRCNKSLLSQSTMKECERVSDIEEDEESLSDLLDTAEQATVAILSLMERIEPYGRTPVIFRRSEKLCE